MFCIFCHFLKLTWKLANFRKFKCCRERGGNFFSGYFIQGGNFFYCIHTGHEFFLDSHFYGAQSFLAPTNIRDNNYFKKFKFSEISQFSCQFVRKWQEIQKIWFDILKVQNLLFPIVSTDFLYFQSFTSKNCLKVSHFCKNVNFG